MTAPTAMQSGFVRRLGDGGRNLLALHCTIAHSGAWSGLAKALDGSVCLVAPDKSDLTLSQFSQHAQQHGKACLRKQAILKRLETGEDASFLSSKLARLAEINNSRSEI